MGYCAIIVGMPWKQVCMWGAAWKKAEDDNIVSNNGKHLLCAYSVPGSIPKIFFLCSLLFKSSQT